MTHEQEYVNSTEGLVDDIKEQFGIDKPNYAMTDGEIRKVIRYIGDRAPDTTWHEGKLRHGRIGIGVMLFLALTEFPEFYMRYELYHWN